MAWCDANDVSFILSLSGNSVLANQVDVAADAVRTRRTMRHTIWREVLAASAHASRPHGWVSISGMSSPTSAVAPRAPRGQAENLIKLHKTQLASERTSCRSPLAQAEFATVRLRLLKLAARINDTATRVRIAFTAACQQAALFRSLRNALCYRPPQPLGEVPHST